MKASSPLPTRAVERPVMFQTWKSLTFLHWRYELDEIQKKLPPGLQADAYDGRAWIGLTPFVISDLHAPFLPALPWISQFPETNVRTYVRGPDGEPGVWFFTLEAARLVAVLGARMLYGLPYHSSEMEVNVQQDSVEYRSYREDGQQAVQSRISILIGEPAPTGELEEFLTARFRLYTLLQGRLACADVEHEPWPLNNARVLSLEQNLTDAVGLSSPRGEPLVHFSHGVHTRIGRPHQVRFS